VERARPDQPRNDNARGFELIDVLPRRSAVLRATSDRTSAQQVLASSGVERVFADIEGLASACRFRDCAHRNEPGCAVQEAIARGALDVERLDRFRALLRESEWHSTRQNARKTNARKKREKEITRRQRAMYRFRDREQ
jgi:hypothetical protein